MSGYEDTENESYPDAGDEEEDLEENEENEDLEEIDEPKPVTTSIKIYVVPKSQRKTSRFLTTGEMTEVIGLRTAQIERGSNVFTDVTGLKDPRSMAIKELLDGKNPLIVQRTVQIIGDKKYVEQWKVREMPTNISILNKLPYNYHFEAMEDIKKGGVETAVVPDTRYLKKANIPVLKNWYNAREKNLFTYVIPELQNLKQILNAKKNEIDPVYEKAARKYGEVTDIIRVHEGLRENRTLKEICGAEVVTNAWLKMWEILHVIKNMLPDFYKKSNLTSLHVAEAPGNFILAMHHFMCVNFPDIKWDWWANSYYDKEQTGRFFGDKYKLIKKYKDKWLLGPEGNGDITSPANIREFAERKVDLVTSDVKFVNVKHDFNEEENINYPVHLGHTIIALMCLKKNGVAVLKELNYFESTSVCLKALLTFCFKKVMVFKPLTSRPANSERYIICVDYLDNLSSAYKDELLKNLAIVRNEYQNNLKPALFKKTDITERFLHSLTQIETQYVNAQVDEITRNLQLFEKYQHLPKHEIEEIMRQEHEKAVEEWLKLYPVKVLPYDKKMLE